MKEEITKTSLSINPELLKSFKLWCVENKISISKKLSEMIKDLLDRRGR